MRRPSALLCLLALALAACANDMTDPDGGPPPPPPGSPRLEIVGSPAVNLRYDAIADLRVRYVTAEGAPIEGEVLEWAIVGDGRGSRIGASQSVTDGLGESAMTVTAGSNDVGFTVEVTPPRGAPARFDVAVADEVMGSITVDMTYAGARTLVRFDVALFDGETCDGMDPAALPTALRSAPSVSEVTARPAFAGLAPGDGYAVAVVARTATHLAAFGCRDGIVVVEGDTPVNVTLTDLEIPPDFTGVWALDNRLDLGGALPPSTEAVIDTLAEIGDDDRVDGSGRPDFELTDVDGDGYWPEYGVDPGAFVTDNLMRQTCRWECLTGEDWDSCSIVDHPTGDLRHLYHEDFTDWDGAQSRFFGGCGAWEFVVADAQDLVNAQVSALLPDFVEAWAQLVSDLARAITNAHILSELTITAPGAGNEFEVPISHELLQMVVDFSDPLSAPPGAMGTVTFDLADAGLTSLVAEDVSTVDGDTLLIPAHSFTMSFGELTLHIYRNVLLAEIFGVTSTAALLASWVDCNQIGIWLEDAINDLIWPLTGPSAATLEGYCVAGVSSVGDRLEAEFADRLGEAGVLTLEGSASAADVDPDTGRVGRLVDGAWSGTYVEGASTGDVTGTFTGVRAP